MALTRITSTVVSANAIVAEKIANNAITTRMIAAGAITEDEIDSAITSNTAGVEARRVANIAGAVSTITTGNLTASRALVSDGSGKVAVSDVTSAEIAHLDGVTSLIQNQLNGLETRRTNNIAGGVSSILTSDLTASRALVSGSGGKVEVSAVTSAEVAHLDGVTSAIQTQLNAKQATITGAATTIDDADLTASRALASDSSGKVAVSAVTATELGHLDGVTSAIQTQLDAIEARRAANNITTTFTDQVNMSDDLVITGNLVVNGSTTTVDSTELTVKDRMILLASGASGTPSLDVGLLFNRGNQGNAAFFYDESAVRFKLSDTKDPLSNTALSPITSSNLEVGILTAATVTGATSISATGFTQNGATLNDLISSNVDGAISGINDTNLTASRALASDGSGKIVVSDVTSTELGHLDGVTSAIQTQFTGAETRRTNNIAGAVSTITTGNLTASRALTSSGSGKVAVSAVTATELGHLDGVTSGIQTQLDTATTNTHSTFTRLNANLNTTTSNVTNLETRLNANLDVIQDNVAALSGSVQLVPHHNVNTSTSTSNVFFIGKNVRSLNNVISITIDGVSQLRDVPGTSNNDFIYHSSNNTIQMTDASLPAGLKVQMFTLFT